MRILVHYGHSINQHHFDNQPTPMIPSTKTALRKPSGPALSDNRFPRTLCATNAQHPPEEHLPDQEIGYRQTKFSPEHCQRLTKVASGPITGESTTDETDSPADYVAPLLH